MPDGCDACPGADDTVDADGDGIPDGCDVCPGADDTLDADGDGVGDACIDVSGIGVGKEVLKIDGCGKEITDLIHNIRFKPDGKWRMESSSGSYKGKYEVAIPGEKYLLSLNKTSKSRLYEYIGKAGKSLCNVKKKLLSPKIKKFTVKLDDVSDTLNVVLVVKYKATDGTVNYKGTYKIILNSAF